MTVDHIIPKTYGGGNDERNLMPLCMKCNSDRASGQIVPEKYYKYANKWAKEAMMEYISKWKIDRTTIDKKTIVEKFGIDEPSVTDEYRKTASPIMFPRKKWCCQRF